MRSRCPPRPLPLVAPGDIAAGAVTPSSPFPGALTGATLDANGGLLMG